MTLDPKTPPKRPVSYVALLEQKGGRLFCTDGGVWCARLNDKQAHGRNAEDAAAKIFGK